MYTQEVNSFTDQLKKSLNEQTKQDKFSGVVLIAKDYIPIFEYVSGIIHLWQLIGHKFIKNTKGFG